VLLPRLVYLMLCRSFRLLSLLARGDVAKDLEILLLRHQLGVLRRQISRPLFQTADRALLAVVSRALPRARWSCFPGARDAAALAPTADRPRLDLLPPPDRPTTAGQGPATADYPPGQREPSLGLPAHQGRLQRLGVQVSATTIRTFMRRHGV